MVVVVMDREPLGPREEASCEVLLVEEKVQEYLPELPLARQYYIHDAAFWDIYMFQN